MLRELSQLLDELDTALLESQTQGPISITEVEVALPLEIRPIFRDGSCRLLADVPRTRHFNEWDVRSSMLRVAWKAMP